MRRRFRLRWCLLLCAICSSVLLSVGSDISGNWWRDGSRFVSRSCESLGGVGSFDTTCRLSSDVELGTDDLYIYGRGNLELRPHVVISCPRDGCLVVFVMSGNINIGQHAGISAGTVALRATNLSLERNSCVNTTALGGLPPSQTSGTPVGYDRAGGGHGGRGASCVNKNEKTSNWGGDVYGWSTLAEPSSYGSKGGGVSVESKYGGNGGGCVKVIVKDTLYLNGSIKAQGGNGGLQGGGGSGGSIFVHANKLKGYGTISASGGSGWGGGGGGRISLDCYSIQEELKVTIHGGESIGCPWNAGAAGTYFNAELLSLRVGNDNVTTQTETPLLDFSTMPLWSNVIVENRAKVLVPLLWTRVQVRGQISVYRGSIIIFGLSAFPVSEFEMVAEELLMSDSIIKVYGAFRVSVKMLLMWNSKIEVDGGGNTIVTTSVLEGRNLIVLRANSVISSNTNLGLYGQGLLQLTGHGDAIKSQRLSLSLFCNITIGPGSALQAPLDNEASRRVVTEPLCHSQTCPIELITPPDDCHVNYTLSFSLQICRIEDLLVEGIIKGSVIHIHRARSVILDSNGLITASGLGCSDGIGKGNYTNGAGSGAGHGGQGGSGFFNGILSSGGNSYGNADLPCELGSGTEGPNQMYGKVIGGGIIVMGSIHWPLLRLDLYGSLRSDGQSFDQASRSKNRGLIGGPGGASGGTILLFLHELMLAENSTFSVLGGNGSRFGGGGGGGGRVHFHWSKINVGDEYVPVASISGSINSSGGAGDNDGLFGKEGTVTGKSCPKGLYGTFCKECPVGTFKDVDGSNENLCTPCSAELLPYRANFIYVRGGVIQPSCPYKCISDKYRMPNCYTPLEELMHAFGGPWPFVLLLSCALIFVGLLLHVLRINLMRSSSSYETSSIEHQSHHQLPHLLSLSEVRGTKAEETQSHVYRMYFMGPNSFREPWHLPYSLPNAIIEIVYEDAFNTFIDEINSVAAYEWWEGSIHSILLIVAYPCAWSWKQWRRRKKIHRLQEYVKSQYDHSCLRSCRSRALYKGMKVGATPDLMVAYIDFFLGGDEKRLDFASIIQKRFPMCIIFGGNGSYMSPFNLHSDTLLTSLLAQHIPATVWNRLVAGLNAQLRIVRQRSIRTALLPVLDWLSSHANPQLDFHGVKIELGWFQSTASGYYQLGILVMVGEYSFHMYQHESFDSSGAECQRLGVFASRSLKQLQQDRYVSQVLCRKKINGGINGGLINDATLKSLDVQKDFFYPLSLFLHNTRPVGREDILQLSITIMLLADLSVTLLTLFECYWISLGVFLAVLLILPMSLLSSFPAGLNALFCKEPRRASLARMYALWNASSLSNIAVAFVCGVLHYGYSSLHPPNKDYGWITLRDGDKWWLLPTILALFKTIQARLVDWHIANLEIRDFSLLCPDPDAFWVHESLS